MTRVQMEGSSLARYIQRQYTPSSLLAERASRRFLGWRFAVEVWMNAIERDGLSLAYTDAHDDPDAASLVFVHGWGCDHTIFRKQSDFFRKTHRVVVPDLRGHGESDAPVQNYTMALFADDLAWLIDDLKLDRPVIIGNSVCARQSNDDAFRHGVQRPHLGTSLLQQA